MLSDVKILDLSTLLPGPYASMMLADLGANVLRVESPTRVDLVRHIPPMIGDSSAAHQYLNRSKQSIALDLKQPEAIEIIKQLVSEYDIILEQFRPGVMDRLGIGYQALKAINPKIIFCSITGYGQTGPYKDRAGHDNNYLSIAGANSYSKRSQQAPVPHGLQIADVAGGSLHSVIGILAALHHRTKTGEGQTIDISMTDCAFALNGMSGAGAVAGNDIPSSESGMLNGGTFYDYYQTSDSRYFSVGSLEPKFFNGLCDILHQPQLKPLANKPDAQAQIKSTFSQLFKQHSFDHWQAVFDSVDLCVEPVLDLAEASQHPQLQAREMVVQVPHREIGEQSQIACPIKFSKFETNYKGAGSSVGCDSEAVLRQLGMDSQQIDLLNQSGAVKTTAK